MWLVSTATAPVQRMSIASRPVLLVKVAVKWYANSAVCLALSNRPLSVRSATDPARSLKTLVRIAMAMASCKAKR